MPDFQQNPAKLNDIYVRVAAAASSTPVRAQANPGCRLDFEHQRRARSRHTDRGQPSPPATASIPNGGEVPLSAFAHFESTTRRWPSTTRGNFRWSPFPSTWRPALRWATPPTRSTKRRSKSACRRAFMAAFQGTAHAFQASLSNEPLLILAALVTVYIVLGVLYESYIHPLTILSTLALGRRGRDPGAADLPAGIQRGGPDRHHPADRHREKERHHDDRLRARGRAQGGQESRRRPSIEACLLRFRPIMMTTMAALLGGLPLALGTGIGLGVAPAAGHHHRRRLAREPGAHALHHAGDLHVLRPPGATTVSPSAQRRAKPGRSSSCRRRSRP